MLKSTIYLDSGHSDSYPGSITQYGKESELNAQIRNALIPELQRCGFEVKAVPDNLNLRDSIDWVNANSSTINDGLALAIHCNCCGSSGAESFFYGQNAKSKEIATKLLDGYCQETGLARSNGGVRSDTTGRFGELGWIRQTKPWATLLEMIYLDNKEDVDFLVNNKEKVVDGIVRGVCNIYGIPYIEETNPPIVDKEETKRKIITLLNQL